MLKRIETPSQKSPRVDRCCKYCGDTYSGLRWKAQKGIGSFCSMPCAKKFSHGTNHPGWKGDRRSSSRERIKKWNRNNPHKARAQWKLRAAVADGRVMKPTQCDECKENITRPRLHGHHDNYDKPFTVRWLCATCHKRVHQLEDEETNR